MKKMRRVLSVTALLSIGGISGAFLAFRSGGTDALTTQHISGKKGATDRILTLRVDGPILAEHPPGGFASMLGGVVSGYSIQEKLAEAARDKTIRGVVVQFQTPGGTLAGARAIYDGIRAYREATSRPIVAHVEGMSASGGVYAMVAAPIYAEPGSLVGSIGVTMGTFQTYVDPTATHPGLFGTGVETRGGIRSHSLYAGRGKDLLNPWREPTQEELSTLQKTLDANYDEFVRHVENARNIPAEVIRDHMGAFVFGNWQAEELRLIDGTMTRREVIAHVAKEAGIDGEYAVVGVVTKKKGGLRSRLLKAAFETSNVAEPGNQDIRGGILPPMMFYDGNFARLRP